MSSHLNKNIIGYDLGELPVKGAITVEILTVPFVPLQAFIDLQYGDSKTMDKRPGMYLKYLPYRYEPTTGRLLTGGAYFFDTWENAKEYGRWTVEDFQVGDNPKIPFWKQPAFLDSARQVWKVAGAHSCAPIQEHAAGRLVSWTYTAEVDIEVRLRELYPSIRDAAKAQGAVGFMLLYDSDKMYVGVYQAFRKMPVSDSAATEALLRMVEGKLSLEELFPSDLDIALRFDRSSLFLTVWLPRSRTMGGSELAIPNYPLVPDISIDHL